MDRTANNAEARENSHATQAQACSSSFEMKMGRAQAWVQDRLELKPSSSLNCIAKLIELTHLFGKLELNSFELSSTCKRAKLNLRLELKKTQAQAQLVWLDYHLCLTKVGEARSIR